MSIRTPRRSMGRQASCERSSLRARLSSAHPKPMPLPGQPQTRCRLRIQGGDPDRPIVVFASEAEDDTAIRITSAAESLGTRVCRKFCLDADTILRVEHHRDRAFFGGRFQFKERFDLVTFDWTPDGCSCYTE